jgi:hypothetical protein
METTLFYLGTFSGKSFAKVDVYASAEAAWTVVLSQPMGRTWPLSREGALMWLVQDYTPDDAERVLAEAERMAMGQKKWP